MKKRTNVLTRVAAIVLAAAMAFGGGLAVPEFSQTVHAENIVEGTLPVVSTVDEGASVAAVYTQHLNISTRIKGLPKDAKGYFKFTLAQDSWVHVTGNYSLCNCDGAGTDIYIYSDPQFSHKAFEVKFGYWRSDEEDYNFVKKGTYYGYVYTEHENYDSFNGNVNVVAYAIPISKIFNIKQKKKKGKTIVSMEDTLGQYAKGVQYINKSVSKSNLMGSNVWKIKAFNWIGGDKKAKMMEANTNGVYQFKAKKTHKYTVMIEDTKGNRYQKAFKVKVKK